MADIYDNIVDDYAALQSRTFKVKYEDPVFWKVLGDLSGKAILDLACGAGYYTRTMKDNGATIVVGVDISKPMILEARKAEQRRNMSGIQYCVHDAAEYTYEYANDPFFDIVTSQFLLPYAESEKALLQFCRTAYNNTKSGGRFVALTSVLDKMQNQVDLPLGYQYDPSPMNHGDPLEISQWHDGIKVQLTLFSDDMNSQCSVPNFLWSFSTIKAVLCRAGFDTAEKVTPHHSVPIIVISASKH